MKAFVGDCGHGTAVCNEGIEIMTPTSSAYFQVNIGKTPRFLTSTQTFVPAATFGSKGTITVVESNYGSVDKVWLVKVSLDHGHQVVIRIISHTVANSIHGYLNFIVQIPGVWANSTLSGLCGNFNFKIDDRILWLYLFFNILAVPPPPPPPPTAPPPSGNPRCTCIKQINPAVDINQKFFQYENVS